MLRRFHLLLLIVLLALPGIAVHVPPAAASTPAMHMAHGGGNEAPASDDARDCRTVCIGCIAPSTARPPCIVTPMPARDALAAPFVRAFASRVLAVEPPPPRRLG